MRSVAAVKEPVAIPKALELEDVPTRVAHKECPLLPRLPRKANAGREDEGDASFRQAVCEIPPGGEREDDAAVGNGNRVAVHRVFMRGSHRARTQVTDQLMPIEIEIDPGVCTSAFRASQERAVERPRRLEVGDRKGDMERGERVSRRRRHRGEDTARLDPPCGEP